MPSHSHIPTACFCAAVHSKIEAGVFGHKTVAVPVPLERKCCLCQASPAAWWSSPPQWPTGGCSPWASRTEHARKHSMRILINKTTLWYFVSWLEEHIARMWQPFHIRAAFTAAASRGSNYVYFQPIHFFLILISHQAVNQVLVPLNWNGRVFPL